MKRLLLCFILGWHFFLSDVTAQTGVHVITGWQNYQSWKAIADESEIEWRAQPPATYYGFALDYWFRLENLRIEFLPSLEYTRTYTDKSNHINTQLENWHWQRMSVHWNTNFYLLEMQDDCTCPSFSKQGNFIENAFFVSLGLGATYYSGAISGHYDGMSELKQFAPVLSLGTGLDFGLSDFLTITPYYKWQYTPSVTWENLSNHMGSGNTMALFNETSAKHHTIGIRVGMRWDAINKW